MINNEYLSRGKLNTMLMGRGMAYGLIQAHQRECKGGVVFSNRLGYAGVYISRIKEIAWWRGFIGTNQLRKLGEELKMTTYGQYLISLAEEEK